MAILTWSSAIRLSRVKGSSDIVDQILVWLKGGNKNGAMRISGFVTDKHHSKKEMMFGVVLLSLNSLWSNTVSIAWRSFVRNHYSTLFTAHYTPNELPNVFSARKSRSSSQLEDDQRTRVQIFGLVWQLSHLRLSVDGISLRDTYIYLTFIETYNHFIILWHAYSSFD